MILLLIIIYRHKHVMYQSFIELANTGIFDDNHKQKVIKFNKYIFTVDEEIHPLILKLWNNGIKTKFSCQGNKNDSMSGYITFDSVNSLLKFFNLYPIAIEHVTIDAIIDEEINEINYDDIKHLKISPKDLLSIRFNNSLINILISLS